MTGEEGRAMVTEGGRDNGHRARLQARRQEATARLASLEETVARIVEGSADANTDDEHDPEGQTIAWDRAQATALADETRATIAAVDAALARLAAGWDGRCQACGEVIPAGRLEARPTADRCVHCAAR